jgi:hypothetical protein
MATDNRGNRFTAPSYLQTLLFIVSGFRRMITSRLVEKPVLRNPNMRLLDLLKIAPARIERFIRRFRASSPLIQRMHFAQ